MVSGPHNGKAQRRETSARGRSGRLTGELAPLGPADEGIARIRRQLAQLDGPAMDAAWCPAPSQWEIGPAQNQQGEPLALEAMDAALLAATEVPQKRKVQLAREPP